MASWNINYDDDDLVHLYLADEDGALYRLRLCTFSQGSTLVTYDVLRENPYSIWSYFQSYVAAYCQIVCQV